MATASSRGRSSAKRGTRCSSGSVEARARDACMFPLGSVQSCARLVLGLSSQLSSAWTEQSLCGGINNTSSCNMSGGIRSADVETKSPAPKARDLGMSASEHMLTCGHEPEKAAHRYMLLRGFGSRCLPAAHRGAAPRAHSPRRPPPWWSCTGSTAAPACAGPGAGLAP